MAYKPKKPTQTLTPDSRLVLSEGKTLAEKLLDVPTSVHVTYKTFGTSPIYFALWKEQRKTYCLKLGADVEGRIAARITEQAQREEATRQRREVRSTNEQLRRDSSEWVPYTCPDTTHTSVHLNCPTCIEARTLNMGRKKMFEQEEVACVKTVFLLDGVPYVKDFATRTDAGEQSKRVKLAIWLWEAEYITEIRGGFDIVQKKPGNNFTIGNLDRVKKPKKEKVA